MSHFSSDVFPDFVKMYFNNLQNDFIIFHKAYIYDRKANKFQNSKDAIILLNAFVNTKTQTNLKMRKRN